MNLGEGNRFGRDISFQSSYLLVDDLIVARPHFFSLSKNIFSHTETESANDDYRFNYFFTLIRLDN